MERQNAFYFAERTMKVKVGDPVIPTTRKNKTILRLEERIALDDGYIIFYARHDCARTPVLTFLGNERALTTDINLEFMATCVRQKAV